MFQDLTLQQFCALDHRRNMVVTAGPGAGKTRILSHRYCFLLLADDQASIPGILTLTFTEKAAEEMKTRIYALLSRMDQLMRDNSGVADSVRKRIHEAREQFFKNHISTIHAFCADLLRNHPVESGLDPHFRIIKGARRKKLLEDAVDDGIARAWQTRREEVKKLFQSFGGRGRLRNSIGETIAHPLIFDVVLKTKEVLFSRPEWPAEVWQDYCHYIQENQLIPYLEGLEAQGSGGEKYESLLQTLKEWQNQADQDSGPSGVPRVFAALRGMVADRKSGETRLAVRRGLQTFSYVNLVEEFYPDVYGSLSPDRILAGELSLYLDLAADCLARFKLLKRRSNGLDFADLESHGHRLLALLSQAGEGEVGKRFQKRFRYIMVDEFQDTNRVQWEIIRRLCSAGDEKEFGRLQPGKLFVVGDKRQAIYRFRGGDVTVFERVTQEIKQSNSAHTPAMFWTDKGLRERLESTAKRDGRWILSYQEQFDKLPLNDRESILRGDIYLPHNFRTDEVPIRFFNQTFQEIFSNKGAQTVRPYETAPQPIVRPSVITNRNASKGSVSIYLTEGPAQGGEQAEAEASLVVDIIEGIMGKRGREAYEYKAFGDIRAKIGSKRTAIGILFFSFTHIKIYEEVLREAGIPFIVHRGKGFFRCREVMDILQLLHYLTDERQRLSLLAALRSPVLGLSDAEIFDLFYDQNVDLDHLLSSEKRYVHSLGKQLLIWRTLADRLTPSELISRIILDRGLTAILSVHPNGQQKIANIEKLIDLARGFQENGEGSIRDFVAYGLEMAEEEEEEGEAIIITGRDCPIYLMTIHAAKGLEFPLVIIPHLNRKIPSRPHLGKPVRIPKGEEGLLPVWTVAVPELGYEKKYSPLGYLMIRRNQLEDMAENRRVFYVGCTRAQNHLLLLGRVKERKKNGKDPELNSDDYREKATIIEMLDDIFDFHSPPFPDLPDDDRSGGGTPKIIWPETDLRPFAGVRYSGLEIEKTFFQPYDQRVAALDLSAPIQTPSYYQLSFKSIRYYRDCPLKFYYGVVLGLRAEEWDLEDETNAPSLGPADNPRPDDDRSYDSRESLIVGRVIHAYLEKHRFGNSLDHDLLERVWSHFKMQNGFSVASSKQLTPGLRSTIQRHLTNVAKDEHLAELLGSGGSYLEVPFLFSVGRGQDFRGFIDCLVRRPESGQWVILDWKSNDLTGRDPAQIAEENDYHLQLACYGWALEEMLGERPEALYLYFTDQGVRLSSHWEGDPKEVVKEVIDRMRAYEKDGKLALEETREREGGLSCRFCEYNGMSPCLSIRADQ